MESTMFVCSVIDDLIGTGSGVSMASDLDEVSDEANRMSNRARVRYRSSSVVVTTTRQYPPPMMNRNRWILRREYYEGRLIMKAERVKRHRHFQVRRENGRLVITIVVSEGEEQKVEVDEESEEEGRGVTCDEMENERGPFDGYVEMGLKAPTGSWVDRYLPPSRPMTPAM